MQDFLGDLIPKGERCGSKQGMFPTKGRDVPKKEKYMQIRGGTKGDHGCRGRPSHHWMVVNIQASVSGSICYFLQILCLL